MKRPFGLPSSLELGTVHLPRFERLLLPVLYVSLNTSKASRALDAEWGSYDSYNYTSCSLNFLCWKLSLTSTLRLKNRLTFFTFRLSSMFKNKVDLSAHIRHYNKWHMSTMSSIKTTQKNLIPTRTTHSFWLSTKNSSLPTKPRGTNTNR